MGNRMATKYYRKDIPEMPVYINGTPLKFEVLETADGSLIQELDKCIAFGRGGVISIGKEEFDEAVKKKENETISESGYKQKLRRPELSAPMRNQNHAAGADVRVSGAFAGPQFERDHKPRNAGGLPGGAAGPNAGRPAPDPIEVPSAADLKPPTAKLSQIAAATK